MNVTSSVCEVKSLFRLISNLSNVHRYSTNFLIKQESVLEHTGCVAILCAAMGLFIKHNTDESIDLGLLMMKATFHDIEESETGDVPRLTKYHNQMIREGLKKFENESVASIAEYTNIPCLEQICEEAKSDREGLIVSIADLMSVTYKAKQEIVDLNNFALRDVAYQSIDGYDLLYSKIRKSLEENYINLPTAEYLVETVNKSKVVANIVIRHLEHGNGSSSKAERY